MYVLMYILKMVKRKVRCYKEHCKHEFITKQYAPYISCGKCRGSLSLKKLIRLNLIEEVEE